MEEKVRAHIVVLGRVQGVWYRSGARQKARELGITGWAHNLIDEKVGILCEGEKEKVAQFIEWCKQGPPLARVDGAEVVYEKYKGDLNDFEIREFGF
jgi:acylphosphatase